jgi:hypothetical protein
MCVRRWGTQDEIERPPVGRFVFVSKGKCQIDGGARPAARILLSLKCLGSITRSKTSGIIQVFGAIE